METSFILQSAPYLLPVSYCVLVLFFSQPLGSLVFAVKSDHLVTMAVCNIMCGVCFAIKHKFAMLRISQ